MAKQLPRLAGTGLRLTHLADGRALRIVLASEAGRGIAQAVGLVAVNSVLAHILGVGSTNARLPQVVPALVAHGTPAAEDADPANSTAAADARETVSIFSARELIGEGSSQGVLVYTGRPSISLRVRRKGR
ncbi:hypothetical protein AB0892_06725 [Streptomyces sp. NPDC005409]|uniref:hypothetical protein n=1 Tax=Streptomyces sp. NPDC005409 TaxID=3155342 RepID=UPI0034515A4D